MIDRRGAREQMPRRFHGPIISLVLLVALVAGVGGYLLAKDWLTGTGSAVDQNIHPQPPATNPTGPATPTTTPTATDPTPDRNTVVMPDLHCMDHQDAQDKLQSLGLRNLGETDGTGQGRLLIIDHNWVVIKQSVSAGERIPLTTKVILTSVKDGEAHDYGC
jgi:PASTA domain-containing protein